MKPVSKSSHWWRKALNLIFNPASLVSLLAAALYSAWFLRNKEGTVVFSVAVATGLAWFYYKTRRFERALREVERARDRAWSPQIEGERLLLREALAETFRPNSADSPSERPEGSVPAVDHKTVYLRGIQLENIRCFESLGLSFEDEDGALLTTIILGDNASGKSTLLRSIALGLCPESDAVSLIKNLPGSLLRKGTTHGSIRLHLRSGDRRFKGSIQTTIEASASGAVIRQTTEPDVFPWDQIFVCGYGTQRTSGRPSSHEEYAARLAVATLFSESADLLNPEVVLLRRTPEVRRRLESILKQILLLEEATSGITPSDRGIELGGPWGSQPLTAVSDGYRSTSQWVLDFLGWQIFANRLKQGEMDGILLLDELEQHLHPRWQRYFLQRLRTQFDKTQIIATSHTPLIAAGVADLNRSQVVRFVPTKDGSVEPLIIPIEYLTGKRADQILADAFGLITSKSPGSVTKIDRYTELISRARSEPEEREFKTLEKELDDAWSSGDNAVTRAADKAVSKVLDEMIDGAREGVDVQVKQRLLDLFGPEEKE